MSNKVDLKNSIDIIPPQRKWTVISWESRGDLPDGEMLPMSCPHCRRWAWLPTAGHPGALVITTFALRVVFDPPDHVPPKGWMPDEIKCAKCRRVWSSKED